MVMCIVSVKGRLDVNVALNRPSYQPSTYIHFHNSLYARYANDGSNASDLRQGPCCAATNAETNPWWAVDLGVALYVWGVKFTNREECCGTYFFFRTDSVRTILNRYSVRCYHLAVAF